LTVLVGLCSLRKSSPEMTCFCVGWDVKP